MTFDEEEAGKQRNEATLRFRYLNYEAEDELAQKSQPCQKETNHVGCVECHTLARAQWRLIGFARAQNTLNVRENT
jgi:hypothetical protein